MQTYVHHVPGRLRIRIPLLRNKHRKIERVKSILALPGVEHIKVNALTGSIVVNYDDDCVSLPELLDQLRTSGYYEEDRIITMDGHLRQASKRAARKVCRAMFGWAVGKVLEAKGLSLIAVFI